jgi:carboxyl-terminal processing protease
MRYHSQSWTNTIGTLAILLAILPSLMFAQEKALAPEKVAPEAGAEFEIKMKSGQDRQISYYVSRGLEDSHLLQRDLDDEISERALKNLLKRLDGRKHYFLQADIEEFNQYKTTLDDLILERDVSVGTLVFRRLIERIDDRLNDVNEILEQDFDFSVDEEVVADGEEETFAADAAAARERWRLRLKHEVLAIETARQNQKAADDAKKDDAKKDDDAKEEDAEEEQTPQEVLRRRYTNFRRRMRQTDSDEILEYYLTAITTSFDPHSTYFSPSSLEDFRIRMGLNYQGIGAEISDVDGEAIIQRIMPKGGAEKGGELKTGDQIVSVGQGEDGEMVDALNMKLQDIIEMIRGPEGTIVRLGVFPKGHSDVHYYSITRSRIELGDNAAKATVLEVGEGEEKKRVGVIDLPSFYLDMDAIRRNDPEARSTSRDMSRLLKSFEDQKIDAVVVDLRRNGGGSLQEAVAATGLFIKSGPVVYVKDTVNGVMGHSDRDPSVAWDGPLVVLTSRFSASASEIFAGALKDYGRAVVVGDSSTHGKGTVQSLQELGPIVFKIDDPLNLGALKITIQQFYRPSGVSTQNRGVISDVVIPSFSEHFAEGEASLPFAVPFDEIPPKAFDKRDDVSATIIEQLNAKSTKRVTGSEKFNDLKERVVKFKELKDRKTIPLQRDKFVALQAQMEDERDEQRKLFTASATNDEVVSRDYYFEEVLSITADLVELSK